MSKYLSITPEDLESYSLLAKKTLSISPKAKKTKKGNNVVWQVGDTTFNRPQCETFIDFLTDHLMYTFGLEWSKEQYALPVEKRHVVMRWWYSLCELQKFSASPNHQQGQWYGITPSGDAMEFMSLADDLYRLRLVRALRPKLIKRLRHHNEFQGARYECAIAASFVRAGFKIEWIGGKQKKCEFVGVHKISGESIAIEVKSRRRPGTLNEPGIAYDKTLMRADVKHLYEKAISQCPTDKPCGIFIDLNLPPECADDKTGIPWQDDLREMLDEFPQPTSDTPALETCLVFTNSGWHYTGKDRAKGLQYVFIFPQYVHQCLNNADTFIAILQSIRTYGEFPIVEK